MLLPATVPALRSILWPVCIGIWAALIALAPTPQMKLLLLAPAAATGVLLWVLYRPGRWLYLFFFCLLALPPLPAPGGDSGLQIAPIAASLGLLAGLLQFRTGKPPATRLPAAFGLFIATLLVSTVFAAIYSGVAIAAGSLIRVLLFIIAVYVFNYTLLAGSTGVPEPLHFTRFLFFVSTGAAIFACVDFYFHLPAPAGYGAQFVWLDQGVFRRAQGLFYEASTLGNFCAFFLVLVLVSLFHPRKDCPIPKAVLVPAGAVFAAALIFSYSRASIGNVVVAAIALLFLRRHTLREVLRGAKEKSRPEWLRTAVLLSAVVAASVLAIRILLPSFSSSYWARLTTTVEYVSAAPNSVLSGRLTNWSFLGDFLWRQPWTAVFGIGYKTLPYSDFAGATVVADNTYLQLLVETGVVGLLAFLWLNREILRTGLRAARSHRTQTRFFGEWIFCFWIGELFQMLSGDLITYWRVLPLYFWVLAVAAKEPDRSA